MKNKKQIENQRTLQEILDSDDELDVDDFVEAPYTPAYLDDNRFEYYREINNISQPTKYESEKETALFKKAEVQLGFFYKKDTLCLECVHREANDTVEWFFDYLLHKDLQSNNTFLKSCLVPMYEPYRKKDIIDIRVYNRHPSYNLVINK